MYPSAELEGFPEFVISLEKQLAEGLPNRATRKYHCGSDSRRRQREQSNRCGTAVSCRIGIGCPFDGGSGSKKFVVKACKDGKEKIVRFGDPKMTIKKNNPKRRKSFRARHKCDTAKDKFSARYWSCKKW